MKALEPIFRLEAEVREIDFSLRVGEGLGSCHRTDAGGLRQILTNLIGNALKFTEHGGVSVELTHGPVKDGQQLVAFAVTDTGIGMAPEELSRVFEPFEQADASTTRRFGGTGLGLTISKRLAQALGGELAVESALGQGSTFTLTLNLEVVPESAVAAEIEAAEAELPEVTGTRVLVAEDNRINRAILSRLLNRAGCIATFVETGTAVLRSAELQDFDIVLMDISMPEMDGYEATRSIRAREAKKGPPMLPILALTAHVWKSCRKKCLQSGMQGMLPKPFRSAQILRAIAEYSKASGGEVQANAAPGKIAV